MLDVAYERIFGPTGEGKEICDVCERESEHGLIEEEDIKKCPLCKSFEELAKQIAKANYIIQIRNDKETRILEKGTWNWAISEFGYRYEFWENVKDYIKKIEADHITIFKLNDSNFLDYCEFVKEAHSPISFGFKFLMNTPLKEFDELADSSIGIKKWGVLRADVDDLGKIFSKGLHGSTFKNLEFVSETIFRDIIEGSKIGGFLKEDYLIQDNRVLVTDEERESFNKNIWRIREVPRVVVDRKTNASKIYHFGETVYSKDSGLYFLIDFKTNDFKKEIKSALYLLGDEGIGGDRTYGKGLFKIKFEKINFDLLNKRIL